MATVTHKQPLFSDFHESS